MKTLIVLPSWGREETAYKKLLATRLKNYDVFVLSYEKLCADRKIENIEKNLITFIQSKRLKSVELLGHSLGGTLGINFAVRHPKLLSRLILIDAKAFRTQNHLFALLPTQRENLRQAGNLKFAYQLVFKTAFRILSNPGLHGKLALWALKFDATNIASKITIPTIILWGENDKSIPVKLGEKLHNLINDSSFKVIPKGSHEWILHSPEHLWESLEVSN